MDRCSFIALVVAAAAASCGGQSTSGSSNMGTGPTTAQEPLQCNAPASPTVLEQGGFTGLAVVHDQALFVDGTVASIPLGGGRETIIARPDDAYGLTSTSDFAFFTANHPVGSPDPNGKQSSESALYMVPIAGGDPVLLSDQFSALATTADEMSAYFAAPSGILHFSPPSTTPATLDLDIKLSVRALAVDGTYLYAAIEDLSDFNAPTGGVVRLPKTGGAPERVLTLAGLPDDIAVDENSLYWTEGAPYGTFGNGHLARAGLDGSNATTLLEVSASAIALDANHLYFLADTLSRIPKSGGATESLSSALSGAGLLRVSGADAVWVDHFSKALSDPTPSSLMAMCVGTGP